MSKPNCAPKELRADELRGGGGAPRDVESSRWKATSAVEMRIAYSRGLSFDARTERTASTGSVPSGTSASASSKYERRFCESTNQNLASSTPR